MRSSTNCGCGHLMTHFVGIAITQQFIVVYSIYMPRWGALLIVVPAPGAAVALIVVPAPGAAVAPLICLDLRVIRAI